MMPPIYPLVWMCGLMNPIRNTPVPLTGVHYDVEVKSFAAHVTINQTFKNFEAGDIECVYGFPISDQASVVNLTVRIGDRTLSSAFRRKVDAAKEYTDAVAQGNGAYLLQQSDQSDDKFELKVGRLPAGQECTVSISYVTTLESVDETKMKLTIPTALTPRFNPAPEKTFQDETGDSPKTYKDSVPYRATLSGHITALDDIQLIMSPTHPLNVTQSGARDAAIEFSGKQEPLNRDLVIEVETKSNPASYVQVEETAPGEYTAMYAFVPRFPPGKTMVNSELIFVVDCSGSMDEGSKLEDARRAMHVFLRSIPAGAYFNFYLFGSTFQSLFPQQSQPYNSQTFSQANAYANGISSNMGGTDILQPLKNVYSSPPLPGFTRQIFVLTDGEVTNTQEVINLVARNAISSRVFAFGLGDSPSRSLVNGIAAAGKGKAEFVKTGDLLEQSVGRQLSRALQPAITDVSVKFDGGRDMQQVPKVLPAVFKGDRQLVFAMFKADNTTGSPSVPPFLELKLEVGSSILKVPVKLPVTNATTKPFLAKLAAREMIREQELLSNAYSFMNPSGQTAAEKVTELSLKYGVLSKEVSLIAVESRNVSLEAEGAFKPMTTMEIPIQQVKPHSGPISSGGGAYGYGGYPGGGGGSGQAQSNYMPSLMFQMMSQTNNHNEGPGGRQDGVSAGGGGSGGGGEASLRLNHLLGLQLWDGTWALTEELAQMGGVTVAELRGLAKSTTGDLDDTVIGTVLAVSTLEQKHAGMRDAWQAMVVKARAYLAKQPNQAALKEFEARVLALVK